MSDVTIDAASIGGYALALGDGGQGFDSFQFGPGGGTPGTINLEQSTVELTLELPTSVVSQLTLTVNDTGILPTTIDEGAVPTTVAGTTGPLTLLSNDPGTIILGNAGSVQGLNGAVDVETPSLPLDGGHARRQQLVRHADALRDDHARHRRPLFDHRAGTGTY